MRVLTLQDLKVLKVKETVGGSKCYILTLNCTNSALPEAVLNASAPVCNVVNYLNQGLKTGFFCVRLDECS